MPINWLADCVTDERGGMFCLDEDRVYSVKITVQKITPEELPDSVAKQLLSKMLTKTRPSRV